MPYGKNIFLLAILFCLLIIPVASIAQDEPQDELPDYIEQIETEFTVLTDPGMVGRVDRIRERLVNIFEKSDTRDVEITVKILDEDSINAFSLPNGYVYFFSGLIDECETDDMLAGVMAHEFTHVYHDHHSRISDRQLRGMLIGLAAAVATGEQEAALLGQLVASSMVETYGRFAEEDADSTGILTMGAAGYDPIGYIELLQVLEQQAIHRPEPGGNYFTVHPHPDERMENIRETLESIGVEVPEIVFRVHLAIEFYEPLSVDEKTKLDEWRGILSARSETAESADETETDESLEIPILLYNEYILRETLFSSIGETAGSDFYGVITIGDEPVFYIAGNSESELRNRADEINSKLGGLFLDGLRDYEIQGRELNGVPTLVARRRTIARVTALDALLLGMDASDINAERVSELKNLIYMYYINRRV